MSNQKKEFDPMDWIEIIITKEGNKHAQPKAGYWDTLPKEQREIVSVKYARMNATYYQARTYGYQVQCEYCEKKMKKFSLDQHQRKYCKLSDGKLYAELIELESR